MGHVLQKNSPIYYFLMSIQEFMNLTSYPKETSAIDIGLVYLRFFFNLYLFSAFVTVLLCLFYSCPPKVFFIFSFSLAFFFTCLFMITSLVRRVFDNYLLRDKRLTEAIINNSNKENFEDLEDLIKRVVNDSFENK